MHPTLIPRPIHNDGWVYEEKVDGWRMLAFKDAGRVRLISRAGRDHTRRFRQIVDALTELQAESFMLAGEVAVFDQELVSHFEWLRHLNHGDLATPPLYMVFDLLHLGEQDYRNEPLRIRRGALEKLVKGQTPILPARRLSPKVSRRGRKSCTGDGKAWWQRTRSRRMWPAYPQVAQGEATALPGRTARVGNERVIFGG
jgi:ATP-dependent DNA ligase